MQNVVKLSVCFLQTYMDYMTRLYEREIKDFFEVAKIKMAGTSKDGKGKFGKTSIKTKYYFIFIKLLNIHSERHFFPC